LREIGVLLGQGGLGLRSQKVQLFLIGVQDQLKFVGVLNVSRSQSEVDPYQVHVPELVLVFKHEVAQLQVLLEIVLQTAFVRLLQQMAHEREERFFLECVRDIDLEQYAHVVRISH